MRLAEKLIIVYASDKKNRYRYINRNIHRHGMVFMMIINIRCLYSILDGFPKKLLQV